MSTIPVDKIFVYRIGLPVIHVPKGVVAAAHSFRATRCRTSRAEDQFRGERAWRARRRRKNHDGRNAFMNKCNLALSSLGNEELLAATRQILRRACVVEADLLVHLAEIEERNLHLEMACSSMFTFCVTRLGFSEDASYNRTTVAHAGKEFPAIIEALRSGEVHLTGVRLLLGHLTAANHREIPASAACQPHGG